MRKQRIFALIAAILLVLVIVGACTPDDKIVIIDRETQKENVTSITFFGYKADEINLIAIEHTLHAFMDEHPDISVNYESLKGKAYWNAFDLRYPKYLDDVIMVDQGHLVSMGDDLADLQDVLNADMFNDFVKSQMVQANGVIKFIPMNLASYCMYINHDLLKADGQPIPQDLQQLKDVCEFYVKEKHIAPIICNNNNSLRTLVEACGFYGANLDIDQVNANPMLLAEPLRKGMELVGEMLDNGWIDAEATAVTTQTAGDLQEFVKGEAPFMVTGGWVSLRIKDLLKDKTMDFGVYPYPVVEDGSVLLVNVATCISVNANSPNLATAKEFVSYFVNPDSVWEYCYTQCSFSPLKNETRIPPEPTITPTAEYYTNGRAVVGADFRLDVPLDLYLTECTGRMLQGATVDEAMEYLIALLKGEQTLD